MRLCKCLCLFALCVPFTLTTVGCGGSDQADQMASDQELEQYGKEAAQGTALEGFKMGPKAE